MDGMRIEISGLVQDLQLGAANGKVLACFQEQQEIELKVVLDEGSPRLISGAIDMIHWRSLNSSIGIAREALVISGVCRAENVFLRPLLVCPQGKWNPAIELVGSAIMDGASLDRAKAVIGLAFSEFMAPSSSLDLGFGPALEETTAQTVRSTVQVALETNGGRVFPNEVVVEVDGELLLKLKGRTKPKPDRSVFVPVPIERDGVLQGFHRRQEVIFFEPNNGSSIEVAFGKLDIDLEWIARLVSEQAPVRLRLHKTRSKRGLDVFAFVRCTEAEAGR